MRLAPLSLAVLVACGGAGASGATSGGSHPTSGSTSGGTTQSATGAASSTTGHAGGGTAGSSTGRSTSTGTSTGRSATGGTASGSSSSAGTTGASSSAGTTSGGANSGGTTGASTGAWPPAGNPDGSCTTLTLPSEAQPVDTSHPTTVVGDGTPASCTFAALASAVAQGGIITFSCGPAPVTILVTSTLTPPTTNEYAHQAPIQIVIDGGDLITLDGGNAVQILNWTHAGSWRVNQDTLTLQHLRLINGKSTPTDAIPPCGPDGGISNTACSTGYDDGEGGALYVQDGNVRIIDCTFADNQAALLGPDTGGGAIYLYGTGSPAYIAQSTFEDNTASNAGAVGMLWAGAFIFNSLFEGNSAVGTGANNDDPTQCTCINNGQNEIGSGGNGGALYKDGGDGVALTICGSEIRDNSANEFGAAVFLTADGSNAQLIIDDSLLTDNPSPISYWNWCTGVSTDNPHTSGSTTCSPSPINSTFCDTSGNCSSTCSS